MQCDKSLSSATYPHKSKRFLGYATITPRYLDSTDSLTMKDPLDVGMLSHFGYQVNTKKIVFISSHREKMLLHFRNAQNERSESLFDSTNSRIFLSPSHRTTSCRITELCNSGQLIALAA